MALYYKVGGGIFFYNAISPLQLLIRRYKYKVSETMSGLKKAIFMAVIPFLVSSILCMCSANCIPAKAGQPLSINGIRYSSKIASSTTILTEGIVSQGKPVYEHCIRYTVTGAGNFSGQVVSVAATGNSNIKIVSSNMIVLTATGSSGNYIATFDVVYQSWNVSSFVSSVSILGSVFTGSASVNVDVYTSATYKSQFYLTGYVTADETQCSGSFVSANGISGHTFRSDFLQAVKKNGSGYSLEGLFIQYDKNTLTYSIVDAVCTASYTVVAAGRTIATDNRFVPRYYRENNYNGVDRAKVYIGSVGFRQSEDAGSDIIGYMIDVYLGVGLPATPAAWDETFQTVTYIGNNLY